MGRPPARHSFQLEFVGISDLVLPEQQLYGETDCFLQCVQQF
jgi:hypothetical protein